MRIANLQTNDQAKALIASLNAPKGKSEGNKFSANPVTIEGTRHDSTIEGNTVATLRHFASGGYITDLKVDKRQLRYELKVNGVWIAVYTADCSFMVVKAFEIDTMEGRRTLHAGEFHLCDIKSAPTRKKRDYLLVKNLMLAIHNIRILEL